ncbi:hypothetical protein ACVWXU_004815 [Streptomyces sp. TE33382]
MEPRTEERPGIRTEDRTEDRPGMRPEDRPGARGGTAPLLLAGIEAAIRASWDADTTTPAHRDSWSPDNPARDQCGVT